MSPALAAAESIDWPPVAAGIALAGAGVWAGVSAWRGRYPGPGGPRPRYQSAFGAAHVAVPLGLAFGLFLVGEIARAALGLDRDGAFFWAISLLFVTVLVASIGYVLVYFATGGPRRLLPPYQRDEQRLRRALRRARRASTGPAR